MFTAITLFSFIHRYCVQFLVYCLLALSELSVAVKRIEVKVLPDCNASAVS